MFRLKRIDYHDEILKFCKENSNENISKTKFENCTRIGGGFFGEVYKTQDSKALKTIKLTRDLTDKPERLSNCIKGFLKEFVLEFNFYLITFILKNIS